MNNAVKNSTDKSMAIHEREKCPNTMKAPFTYLFLNLTVMTLGQILAIPVALLAVYICIRIGSIRRQFRDLVSSPFVAPIVPGPKTDKIRRSVVDSLNHPTMRFWATFPSSCVSSRPYPEISFFR